MSTYVIGDVQGCYESLMNLIGLLEVDAESGDRLWIVGDLVNRGPRSEDVLWWAYQNRAWVQIILGNHDLHLLAHAAGADLGRGDTLDGLMCSPRRDTLIDWLRAQPLLHEAIIDQQSVAMVHAGVNPRWSWSETRARARRAEAALQSDDGLRELALAHPTRKAHRYRSLAHDTPQWIQDLEWFTRVRALCPDLTPHARFKGQLTEMDDELTPWFSAYEAQRSLAHDQESPDMLYFGHWAALGFHETQRCTAIDLGCIWGRGLGAIRVEDRAIFTTPTAEVPHTPKPRRVSPRALSSL